MRRLLVSFSFLALVAATAFVPAEAGTSPHRSSDALERFQARERHAFRSVPNRSDRRTPRRSNAVTDHFRVLGHVKLPADEVHADVGFYDYDGAIGKHAFVGSWGGRCAGTGVKVIDVNDPRSPTLVSIAGSHKGESHEDMDLVRIGHRVVMAVGVQTCGKGGRAGLDLIDVTDPSDPSRIAFFPTPSGGVHELDVVERPDGRVLALLAVPSVEFDNTYFGGDGGGEFRIVNITDPGHPKELSSWGIIADSSLPIVAGNDEVSSSFQGVGSFAAYYDHSVRGADDGMTAYVSYWDGGVLKFDIGDPAHPKLLTRTTFPLPADGDAHSMTPYDVGGHRFIFQNDEDGDAFSPPTLTSSATGGKEYFGIEEPWAPTVLSATGPVSGHVFDAGAGCRARDYDGAKGKIAVADSVDPFYVDVIDGWGPVPCPIGRQVVLAARAGAKAFVSNLVSPDDAWPYFEGNFNNVQTAAKGMPVVQISDIDDEAQAIRDALANGPVTVKLDPSTPTHGFIRVFREDVGQDKDGDGVVELRQVGKFDKLPHVTGSLDVPPGSWEVHNTEVRGKRAYSSWYSNGIVALRLGRPAHPSLAGQFVPPPSDRFHNIFGAPFPLVWGVAIDPETGIVYASDMRSGLWIVEPTGEAAS